MKALLKSLARIACLITVLPALVLFRLFGLVVGSERAFADLSQLLALLPGTVGVYQRQAAYRMSLRDFGGDVWLSFGALLTHPDTRIGPFAYVGSYTILGRVTLERDVLVGSFVSVMNGNRQHGIERLDVPVREQPGDWPHVTIGEDSWIGDHAVIMANVGKHCVVAAASVVTRPVPDYAIVAGCPAQILRYRNQPELSNCSTAAGSPSTIPSA